MGKETKRLPLHGNVWFMVSLYICDITFYRTRPNITMQCQPFAPHSGAEGSAGGHAHMCWQPRYPQLSTDYPRRTHYAHTNYPRIIHRLSTKRCRRTCALPARSVAPQRACITGLLARHGHGESHHTMRQRLAGQQPPGGLNTAHRIRWSVCTCEWSRSAGRRHASNASRRKLK